MESPAKIAIIGAGPAGCMLARLLHQADIPSVVFERDASPDYRSQGGTLDLHEHTGLAAVQQAGLWDEFLQLARYDGQSLKLADKDLRSHFTMAADRDSNPRPEIDRGELRRLLFESLPEGTILWRRRLLRVEEGNTLVFEEETVTGFDLVVGADGAWSKVRQLLTSEKPFYAGMGGFQLSIPDAKNTAPKVYEYVNRGTVLAYGDSKTVSMQQLGDGGIDLNFSSLRDESWMDECGYDVHNVEAVQTAIKKDLADWNPLVHEAVTAATTFCRPRALYMLPVGFRWEHRKGVTLIGDAANLMTPFAGEGVNLAFLGSMLLAKAITESLKEGGGIDALDGRIQKFEAELFAVAKRAQELTDTSRQLVFSPGFPEKGLVDWYLARVKYHVPPFLYPVAVPIVRSIYFVKSFFS